MPYQLAIFDFDGTLADSFGFFLSVFSHLAAQHGFRAVAAEEAVALRRYDARQMMQHLGLPLHKLPPVTRDFIGLMRQRRTEIRLFEGVPEVLAALHEAGIQLAVVSSNARDNVLSVLGPATARRVRYLECGMSLFGKRKRLKRVLRRSGVAAERALYVGDQATDLEAARAEGLAFGAVAWGYGDIAALRALAPAHEFHRVAELEALISRSRRQP